MFRLHGRVARRLPVRSHDTRVVRRRQVLELVGCFTVAALVGERWANVVHAAALSNATYGVSRQGRPLLDVGPQPGGRLVLVVGGIHAGSEANTVALVQELSTAVQADPSLVPPGLSVAFVTSANPDGLANGARELASGVDPNRNWPTDDWRPDTYVTGPTLVPGGGGPSPLSEPETRALAALVSQLHPSLIISYHSAAGLVTGGPAARAMGLEAAYADTAGYQAGDFTAYPVTGDFAQWAESRQHIPTVEIELWSHTSSDLDENLAAVRATLSKFAHP